MTPAKIAPSGNDYGKLGADTSAGIPSEPPQRLRAVQRGAMHQYQRAQVETASPTRLVVLLYDGAIRFCSLAQDAMGREDLESQNTNLKRAQRIIGELMGSLNRNDGGDVASNLFSIYSHLLESLVKANFDDDRGALRHVVAILHDMRETWVEIDRMTTSEQLCSDPGTREGTASTSGVGALIATNKENPAQPVTNVSHSPAVHINGPAGRVKTTLGDRGV